MSISAGAVVEAFFGSYDLRTAKKWREEDLNYREQEIQWHHEDLNREKEWRIHDLERNQRYRKLSNERRIADTRSEQLCAISNLSAILGGFSIVMMVEINLPEHTNLKLLIVFGSLSAIVIVLMLLCMMICTILLVAITRYSSYNLENELHQISSNDIDKESPFSIWWIKKCETDWLLAYLFFRCGVSFFFMNIILLSWVQFHNSKVASIGISIIAFIAFLYWLTHLTSRWRYLIHRG